MPPDRLRSGRGIEVGHIFYFGTKYSEAMGATVMGPDGSEVPVEMGSYGIGVSRLVGALIEAFHDEKGIVWPESVAPFRIGLVNLRPDDAATTALAEDLYGRLHALGVDVLMDDRDERAGVKFATMELIGLPWQVVVGPRGAAEDRVELKNRAHRREARALARGAGGALRALMAFGRFERLVAWRYLRPTKGEGFISVIAGFALVGIALGRRHADRRAGGDERLSRRAAGPRARRQRPRHRGQRPGRHRRLRRRWSARLRRVRRAWSASCPMSRAR